MLYLMEGVSAEAPPTKNIDVRVEKIGLKIPKATRYEDFVEKIGKSEKQFLDKLNLWILRVFTCSLVLVSK